ncbi:MAG: Uma2 family endonuclease [Anaerolineae bacterium]|nr:Uma2 family endonuclease [Anaerolineae bacterium]
MLKTLPKSEIEYPESDGLPMAETDEHRIQMTDALIHPLRARYHKQGNVYVSGNLFFYYEEGNREAVVAPDVFVVFGVTAKKRRTYKLWEEGHAPDVVFELTSRKTYEADLGRKRLLYEDLGVREYFLFDPLREYLRPPLQGFRLTAEGYYDPLRPQPLPTSEWQLESQVLSLQLHTHGSNLRLYDGELDAYLRMPEETESMLAETETILAETETILTETETALRSERKARELAEAEISRLKALLAQKDS